MCVLALGIKSHGTASAHELSVSVCFLTPTYSRPVAKRTLYIVESCSYTSHVQEMSRTTVRIEKEDGSEMEPVPDEEAEVVSESLTT